jgi:hypothetical protein
MDVDASVAVPLQFMFNLECDLSVCLDPITMDSVLPKCNDNLSIHHWLTEDKSLDTEISSSDKLFPETFISELSAYNNSLFFTHADMSLT